MIRLTGVKEIDRVLKGLPKQINHKVLQSAIVPAGKPLIEAAKGLAPEGPTGDLVDSIGAVKTNLKKANSIGETKFGPRRSRRHRGHHGHLVEYGTKKRTLLGKGNYARGTNRGSMRKKPFMEPAWNRTQNEVKNRISTELGKSLYRYMKRVIKS